MANKNFIGIIIGFTLVMSAVLFSSCSTFPTLAASGKGVSYTMLGYVGASFGSYDEAFNEAKQKFPEADGVVVVTGKADNNLIPVKMFMGYYAVKFTANGTEPRKKFLGIF